ncbi:adenylate isopentenyltransferase-like [Syzygium oleosum]|uniref:adenylate isopentenyltransferase-like n=1 Tax=Syzygium oleosum TaxID=219896 RepID=UPI0011D1DA38|nr:adenylate isopentenyltransferase-like [Syzygium oleosum]
MKLLFLNPPHSPSSKLQSLFSFHPLFPPPNNHGPISSTHHKPTRWSPMASSAAAHHRLRRGAKVVVIMGATGCGKSRLSIDLASLFPSEVINSDKMQVYRGLDITTNKITPAERHGVPHHLLGSFDPDDGEMSPSLFRSLGHAAISGVASRGNLPLLVGGSNSFIHALLVERFDLETDVFGGLISPAGPELRYDCCFLWVDVSLPVLEDYLSKRVDDMLDAGMFEELAQYYDPGRTDPGGRTGLRKAIGVPEFDRYFKKHLPRRVGQGGDDWAREDAYEEAVREIKENTRLLARRQVGKILRLRSCGWELRRLDATEAFRLAVGGGGGGGRWRDVWEGQVVGPSVKIVNRFLQEK